MRTKHSQKEIHTFKNAIKLILFFLGLAERVGGVAWINEVPLFAYPASQGGLCRWLQGSLDFNILQFAGSCSQDCEPHGKCQCWGEATES